MHVIDTISNIYFQDFNGKTIYIAAQGKFVIYFTWF